MTIRGRHYGRWSPGVAIVLSVACCSALLAAPPTVKHLLPSGAQRGISTQITANGDFSNWPVQVWSSESALSVECSDEKGKLNVTARSDVRAGLHFIRLYDGEGASRALPFVVGNLPEVVEKSSNDSPGKAEVLPSSIVTVNGRLEKRDDVDVYAVELGADQTVVASALANETLASPMDAVLQILSADGSVLAQNDDWLGLDPQLVFTAPSAGKYLVRIFAFPAQPDSRIGLAGGDDFVYRLTITTGPFVDYTWPLVVQQNMPGNVELCGWNIGEAIKRQSVSTADQLISIDGDQFAGHHRLVAEPHLCLIEDDLIGQGELQAIGLPTTISARLHAPGDFDTFRFQAKRGESIRFQLVGRELGSPLDALLEVFDSSGKSLVRTDDSGRRRDPEFVWKAPADGAYDVKVADLHGFGGARFFYRLRVAIAKPDFAIKSAEHAFVGSLDKPLEITLEIDRRQGFDEEIIIKPEGLPDSIVAEPVKSPKDGESAKKVKLKLTAGAAYSGPLRIIGVAQGTERLVREGLFTSPSNAEISDLWLTVKTDKSE
jgi:hypothetical protein